MTETRIGMIQDPPPPPPPFRALMLAKAIFDPSGDGDCAKVKVANDSTSWETPTEGALGVMAGKETGVAVFIIYRELIASRDGFAYWSFDLLDETDETTRLPLKDVLRAYRPAAATPKAPTLPGMGEKE